MMYGIQGKNMVRRYVIIGILAVLICILFMTAPFQFVAKTALLFPSRIISAVLLNTHNFFSFLVNAKKVDQENIELKEKIASLEAKNNLYEIKISDYDRMFKYKPLSSRFVMSRVIARDPTNWFKMISVDRGRDDGISENMPVLNSMGIVGRISTVENVFSNVLLAIDKESRISAIVSGTRELGIVEGTGHGMIIKFFSRTTQASPGDLVLTSGFGGVFPKGLVLGNITSVNTEGLEALAHISPQVEFDKLEEVLVLIQQ